MYLEEIINDLQLESDKVECKSRLNRDDVVGWLKSIAGFANASGGDFYIGVEDKTNRLIGFERTEADNERNYFNNQVNEHLIPRPKMKISFVRYEMKGHERFIIRIQIPESVVRPVILKYKNIPSIYMRRDGFTNGATYEEIIDMSVKSKNTQYDILDSDRKYEAGDFNTLREFYASHNDGKVLTEKALRSMGFYNEAGTLANGALLFADDYQEKKTEVQCSVFSGFNKGSERIVTINRFCGNIISAINYMMEFVTQRMNHSLIKLGESRKNVDAYPRRALFEGVINAVAHRDYFLDGTQIQVDMFRNRLEISSPGGFYRGEKLGKTYDLSGIISKRRNELISAVLVSCNVMEAAGTGFDKIIEEYREADETHRPYIYSSSDHFTLTLPDLTYEEGIAESNIPILTFVPVPNGTDYDGKVLAFCYFLAHKASEIAEYLEISDSTYFRKQILQNLVQNGYLEADKVSRAVYYRTNPDMVLLN
ncbi:ATP-binding protein [Acetatifactor muris]|uniref:ATP-binding protein n=1 Tax=Acetatifactor muris TaxID=879566 RepID=UPI0023F3235E|nr:ATP-binding protein [Acetatifactor muris]MCI8798487.1 AAA family ATPase [Lachnospiraceae bacterium]